MTQAKTGEALPRVCLYAKASTGRNYWNLTIELKYLIGLAFRGDPRISIEHRFD